MVKYTESNISKFLFLNFGYKSYHWKIWKKIQKKAELEFSEFAISEIAKIIWSNKYYFCRVVVSVSWGPEFKSIAVFVFPHTIQ